MQRSQNNPRTELPKGRKTKKASGPNFDTTKKKRKNSKKNAQEKEHLGKGYAQRGKNKKKRAALERNGKEPNNSDQLNQKQKEKGK